jgi:hypothetical protein
MDDSPSRRPTLAQVSLGLFVVWQLAFLFASNLIAFVPHGDAEEGEMSDSRRMPVGIDAAEPIQKVTNLAGCVTDCWAHLTGQIQAWWLFAPSFPSQSTFPVVELRWDDPDKPASSEANLPGPPVRLHSVLEPENPSCYFRPPGSFDRLFHYEVRLGLLLTTWNGHPKNVQEYAEWEDAIRNRVRRQWKSMRAYMRWRIQEFQKEHPELPPPTQAILIIRVYPSAAPERDSSSKPAPLEKAYARWRPAADGDGDFLPVEMCEPRSDHFVRLARMK